MNDKSSLVTGERVPVEDTDLDVPDLPGDWSWGTSNYYGDFNHKVNVYFGLNQAETGGYLGEIDNWVNNDGDEMWTLHVRPIRGETETAVEHDSLDEAIDAVPSHIATHYPTEVDL